MQKIISTLALMMLFMLVAFTSKHSILITGKVTDANGNPVSFCTIKEKGTRNGVSADASGNFSITVKENAILVISAAGYNKVEIATAGKKTVAVTLESTARDLEEVVVVGYSVQKRRDVTGSVQRITMDQLISSPQPSVNNTLAGKVAGLQVTTQKKPVQFKEDEDDFNREGYDKIEENIFHKVNDNPLSTFSIDVDAASYSNMRRFINAGQLPPAGAVRIEEMINYFKYEYPQPREDAPFSVNTELATCPWNSNHKLALIGLQGKIIFRKKIYPPPILFF